MTVETARREQDCDYCHHRRVVVWTATAPRLQMPLEMFQLGLDTSGAWAGFKVDDKGVPVLVVACSRACLEGLLS